MMKKIIPGLQHKERLQKKRDYLVVYGPTGFLIQVVQKIGNVGPEVLKIVLMKLMLLLKACFILYE